MTKLPAHPDTIAGLEPDCRRVLHGDYMAIQAASDRTSHIRSLGRSRTDEEVNRDVAAAVAEYRRTAALWGVEA